MGLFANLFAKPVSGAVVESLGAAGSLAKDIRTAITGQTPVDPVKVMELENQLLTAQAEINQAEASHPSIFVAGWRPFIGWVCGLGIAMEFLVRPMVQWFRHEELPVLDVTQLIALVIAMLGVAGYRTIEKANGTVGKH